MFALRVHRQFWWLAKIPTMHDSTPATADVFCSTKSRSTSVTHSATTRRMYHFSMLFRKPGKIIRCPTTVERRTPSTTQPLSSRYVHQKETERLADVAVTSCHQRRGMYSASPALSSHTQRGTAARRGSPASSCAAPYPILEGWSKGGNPPARRARQARVFRVQMKRFTLPQTEGGSLEQKPCPCTRASASARKSLLTYVQLALA